MNPRLNLPTCGFAAMLIALSSAGRCDAGFQLIANGDFEAGLSGWTTTAQAGSNGGWFVQTGTRSPLTSFPVQAPPGPTRAAMSDGFFGSQVLYQDFLVPQDGVASATLSFDWSIANQNLGGGSLFNPLGTLDYTVPSNRQARVDILGPSADPFSVNPGDVLLNLFRTEVGDPAFSGYTTRSVDLTALLASRAGQTLRLRFAEVNSQLFIRSAPLNFGVDLISLDVTLVPEPASLALLAFGALGLAGYAWRRRGSVAGSGGRAGPVAARGTDP